MLIEVVVPSVGESINEVEIGEWQKSEGAAVERDDTLVTIETDKASVEIPAPQSGTLAQILKRSGETAAVGEAIARIESANGEASTVRRPTERAASAAAAAEQKAPLQAGNVREARKEAEQINGASSRQGGIETESKGPEPRADGAPFAAAEPREAPTPEEVAAPDESAEAQFEAPLEEPATSRRHPAEPGVVEPEATTTPAVGAQAPALDGRREESVRMTPLRRRIAERLVQAQQTAALLTTFNEIDMSRVMELRAQYRERFEQKYNVKLGIMSFFVKASVAALKALPEINAEIRGETIVYRRYYDIGIAVGGGKGLVVPVLRDAEHKSFAEIEIAIADFARRAREARLNPQDLEGGTFTITNGGIYGSLLSTPIVNPPQTAILGMHAIQDRPVARDGAVVIRPMMYVALTYDHRLVDGREAVTFLRQIKELVEDPTRLLFEI